MEEAYKSVLTLDRSAVQTAVQIETAADIVVVVDRVVVSSGNQEQHIGPFARA